MYSREFNGIKENSIKLWKFKRKQNLRYNYSE